MVQITAWTSFPKSPSFPWFTLEFRESVHLQLSLLYKNVFWNLFPNKFYLFCDRTILYLYFMIDYEMSRIRRFTKYKLQYKFQFLSASKNVDSNEFSQLLKSNRFKEIWIESLIFVINLCHLHKVYWDTLAYILDLSLISIALDNY